MYVYTYLLVSVCICLCAYARQLQYRILVSELSNIPPHRAEGRSAKVNPRETGCEDRGQGWTLLAAEPAEGRFNTAYQRRENSERLSNSLIRPIPKSRKFKGYRISLYVRLCNCLTSVGKIKVRKQEMFERHYLRANHAIIFVFISIKLKKIKKK